jgi:hypothetical protein
MRKPRLTPIAIFVRLHRRSSVQGADQAMRWSVQKACMMAAIMPERDVPWPLAHGRASSDKRMTGSFFP